MKILVTGAAGFIGRHVLTLAIAQGHEVIAWGRHRLVLPGLAGNLPPDFLDDVGCTDSLEEVEAVIHLAGDYPRFGSPRARPIELFNANAALTTKLLDACSRAGVRRFVLASTAAVYGGRHTTPLSESQALDAGGAYAASKACAEMMCRVHHADDALQTTCLRLFNVFGPGQAGNAIVPSLVRQALEEDPVRVADDRPTCDFVFVTDVAAALLAAACTTSRLPDVLNIGSGRGTSIAELGTIVMRAAGRSDGIHAQNAASARVTTSIADAGLAATHLGWRASTTLEMGVRTMIDALRAAPTSRANR